MNLSEIFLADGTTSPKLMLWAFFVAAVIATIVYYLINVQLGKLVSRLLELGASSPETAVTLDEAEVKPSFFLNFCLRSPMNYKDLLVAITSNGKYYANSHYTDEPPVIRELKAITRKQKSRVKDSEANTELEAENEEIALETPENSTSIAENSENIAEISKTKADESVVPSGTPQKVNFNIMTAKYYIPKEVHDKVKGIYKKPKVKLIYLILTLILLGVVVFLAGIVLDIILDSLMF